MITPLRLPGPTQKENIDLPLPPVFFHIQDVMTSLTQKRDDPGEMFSSTRNFRA
ncbi:MAG: hypothetical protein ABIO65_09980 [Nitrospiria bacterium]